MPRYTSFRELLQNAFRLFVYKIKRLLWKVHCRLGPSVTIDTIHGKLSVISGDHAIGWRLYYSRQYETELTSKALDLVYSLPGSPPIGRGVVLDIGASIGVTSIGMVHNRLVEAAIAIEPEPLSFSLLLQNVRQNHLEDRFICLQLALSDKSGTLSLEANPKDYGLTRVAGLTDETTTSGPGNTIIEVPTCTLDDLVAKLPRNYVDDISIIWIDVEGYEAHVFKGGKRFLSKNIPVVAEFFPNAMKFAGVSIEEYVEVARRMWSDYWVMRAGKFIRYPISTLDILFEEFDHNPKYTHTNIILTR